MSYEERSTWVVGIVAVASCVAYLVLSYVAGGGPLDGETYAWPMVWALVGAVAVGVVSRIVIGAVGSRRVDQRDEEIDWLGSRVGSSFVVIGGLGALVLCLTGAPHVYIANVLYFCFLIAAVLQSLAKLVAYRRGV